MKRVFRILMIAASLATLCTGVYAQKTDRQRMTREQLAEHQAGYIARELAMDNSTKQQFIETYCQFQKDIWALGPRPERKVSETTDEEAGQAIQERFDYSQKILNLRQEYYAEYSKFLTQKQINRVYEIERQMMHRLSQQNRLPKQAKNRK